tara:strand:+ start:2325 stop:3446 length:1122 start_codon:yes stop_codon:yes gene_type:complete
MGFDDVLNIFLPKHTLSKKDIKKYLGRPQTKDSRNHLLQGVRLGNLREGFEQADKKFIGQDQDGKRGMKIKEEKALKKIETEYDKTISEYATAYQDYLLEFSRLNSSMKLCAASCRENITSSDADYVNKRKACNAGCQLKGVQIQKCRNSYKGLSTDTSKKCHHLVANHCNDGSVNPGASSSKFVRSQTNADNNKTTLLDGCCECGGGVSGKPKGIVNNQEVKNCDEVNQKLGNSPEYKSLCLNAGNGVTGFDATANANFINKYNNVKNKNDAAMNQMNKLAKKINILTKTRDRLKGTIASEEDTLDQNLKEFEEKYALLQSYGEGGKDYTSIAQFESTATRKSSEELKFYMWSVLAIVLMITVVSNFKRKSA